GLELGRARAHVALEDVDMCEEPEGFVHEVVVVVISAVHGARAFSGFPERILFSGHRAQFGQDLLAGLARLGQRPMDLEPVGVGVAGHGVDAPSAGWRRGRLCYPRVSAIPGSVWPAPGDDRSRLGGVPRPTR